MNDRPNCHICGAPARHTLPDSCEACYALEVEAVTSRIDDAEIVRRYELRRSHFGLGRPPAVVSDRRGHIQRQLA